jgi:peptide/nickel transport system ATP-binding protein
VRITGRPHAKSRMDRKPQVGNKVKSNSSAKKKLRFSTYQQQLSLPVHRPSLTRQLRIHITVKRLTCVGTSSVSEAVALCEIAGLSISYALENNVRVRAVDNLSLSVRSKEVIGILGESGSGKSTLGAAILRSLSANAHREQGTILFRGRDLWAMPESELRRIRGREISLLLQDPSLSLNPVLTVGCQIAEPIRSHLPLSWEQRRMRVLELLANVGFGCPEEIYAAYPHQLSGGQRQRVAIAQAISCHPSLLIADEPTSKLDAPLQTEIISMLARIHREHGLAILLISHDPAMFAGFADRTAIMYAGKIIELGPTTEVFREPLHPYTQALLQVARQAFASPGSARSRFAAIEGESPDPSNLPAGCRFYPRCPVRMDVCDARDPQTFLPQPSRPVNCFKYGE